ncbi:hypothetical protein D3C71_1738220 [compost metagenome]
MQAKGTVGQVQTVVEQHLVDGRSITQVLLLEVQGIGVQRLVALHPVLLRVTLAQVIAQPTVGDQLAHLILQGGGIGLEIFQHGHRGGNTGH